MEDKNSYENCKGFNYWCSYLVLIAFMLNCDSKCSWKKYFCLKMLLFFAVFPPSDFVLFLSPSIHTTGVPKITMWPAIFTNCSEFAFISDLESTCW